MPSALTSMRGAFLNCRFAVNGIQKASRLLVAKRVWGASATVASARAIFLKILSLAPLWSAVRTDRQTLSIYEKRRDFLTKWSTEN
jgi:hypothetical protein